MTRSAQLKRTIRPSARNRSPLLSRTSPMLSVNWTRLVPGMRSSRTIDLTVQSSPRSRPTSPRSPTPRRPAERTSSPCSGSCSPGSPRSPREATSLRPAAAAAKGEEARRLAVALGELAAMLRDLDTAAKLTVADARASIVATVTHDQDAITKRAAILLGKLDTPARLAGVALPVPDDFRRVADLAAAGKTVEAARRTGKTFAGARTPSRPRSTSGTPIAPTRSSPRSNWLSGRTIYLLASARR